MAENMSAYLVTCSAFFLSVAAIIFLYLQKYGFTSRAGEANPRVVKQAEISSYVKRSAKQFLKERRGRIQASPRMSWSESSEFSLQYRHLLTNQWTLPDAKKQRLQLAETVLPEFGAPFAFDVAKNFMDLGIRGATAFG